MVYIFLLLEKRERRKKRKEKKIKAPIFFLILPKSNWFLNSERISSDASSSSGCEPMLLQGPPNPWSLVFYLSSSFLQSLHLSLSFQFFHLLDSNSTWYLESFKISELLFEPKSQNSSFWGRSIRLGRGGGLIQKGSSQIRTVTETYGHGKFLFNIDFNFFLSIKLDSFLCHVWFIAVWWSQTMIKEGSVVSIVYNKKFMRF